MQETCVFIVSGEFSKREDVRQRKAKEEKRQQTQAERWERAVMMDPSKPSVTSTADFDAQLPWSVARTMGGRHQILGLVFCRELFEVQFGEQRAA